jgi:signal transduction histidine kinase
VRASRMSESLDRARLEAQADLREAASFPRRPFDAAGLLSGFENSGVHVILMSKGHSTPSNPRVSPTIPRSLLALVGRGDVAYQRVRERAAPGRPSEALLIVGGGIGTTRDQLYFVFSEQRLENDLTQLRNILLVGWAIVVALAAAVGSVLARQALEPVGRASQAARDMAEGLLDTRLPEEGADEFGVWAASFNRMADALEAKITALSEAEARERRFTSDVAHELRTPVAALVAEASLLRDQLDAMPGGARRVSELVVRDIGRLRRLVEDLMEISRFDAGRENVIVEPVDVRALLSGLLRSHGWEGAVRLSGDSIVAQSDRRRLERILSNLVGNAVEHGGASVEVHASADPRGLVIDVSDRGPGIAPEHLPHLFERFYKADRSRTGQGSGLGLAIAMENARLLGGTIEAHSELRRGTRFIVVLPIGGLVAEPLREGEPDVSPEPDHEAVRSSEGGSQ